MHIHSTGYAMAPVEFLAEVPRPWGVPESPSGLYKGFEYSLRVNRVLHNLRSQALAEVLKAMFVFVLGTGCLCLEPI